MTGRALNYPDYPFTPRRVDVRPGIAMSYLDEGPRDGEVIVMLHGNPSWSFYWRHLVSALSDSYRCIVPDHVGMGLSDKPDDAISATPSDVHGRTRVAGGRMPEATYDYTLQSRIDDLDALFEHLGIDGPVTLAVHDWGGMIGLGWALRAPARVRRLVITNTSSFPLPAAKRLPIRIAMGRHSRLGGWLIRRFNLFARGAAWMGTTRALPREVRAAYAGVYDGWEQAISTLRFMQDIPLDEGDRAWPLVDAAARQLPNYADRPVFIGWGLRDFVFDRHFLDGFRAALPDAEVHAFADANHYVLEDKHEVLVPMIREFLDRHPLGPNSPEGPA
jgi:haloalkane dehalogenase